MLRLPTSDNAKNYRLNMALFRLGHSEDFKLYSNWLFGDEKARLESDVIKTEGTPCHRIQGVLQALEDLLKFQRNAQETADAIKGVAQEL